MFKFLFLFILTAGLGLNACTMPLPVSNSAHADTPLTNQIFAPLNPEPARSRRIAPLAGISLRSGLYKNQLVQYFELNSCLEDPTCSNEFSSLKTSIEYQFIYPDGREVPGQFPVIQGESDVQEDFPFRHIYTVTVPVEYEANAIRSQQEVFSSSFRIRPSQSVMNHPFVQEGQEVIQQPIKPVWFSGQKHFYLDLGPVPYAAARDQLGTASVYFMLNRDRSELPAKPAPIFDTLPGDLLYSPIRQVFRVISENQIVSDLTDPSRQIRSQEDLLTAVNRGLFRLEPTQLYFNLPAYLAANPQPLPPIALEPSPPYQLVPTVTAPLPPLPIPYHYALWLTQANNESRLLLRLRPTPGGLVDIKGTALVLPVLAVEELENAKNFFVTVESTLDTSPSHSTLLAGTFGGTQEIQLMQSFPQDLVQPAPATYILSTPSDGDLDSFEASGLWFIRRANPTLGLERSSGNLVAGLPLPPAPPGWVYQGWLKPDFRTERWLSTGSFSDPSRSDQSALFSGSQGSYPFPGEDFLQQPPAGLSFPFNLIATGDVTLAVSLEPRQATLPQPFLVLYQQLLTKGAPLHREQTLPAAKPAFPEMRLHLRRNP